MQLLVDKPSNQSNIAKITQPLNISQIKRIARKYNATLVEYSVISSKEFPDEILIWVIQPTGKVTYRYVKLESKEKSLEELIYYLYEWRINTSHANLNIDFENIQPLEKLNQLLIEPIADLLPTNPQEQVIFIPHKQLFMVPFPALHDSEYQYLIEKHTILTAPSIKTFDLHHLLQKQRFKKLTEEVLIVGNPQCLQYQQKNL